MVNKLKYFLLILSIITKINSITIEEEVSEYFCNKTIDHIRQLTWSLVEYCANNYPWRYEDKKEAIKEGFHSFNRLKLIETFSFFYPECKLSSPNEIEKYNLFKVSNLSDIYNLVKNEKIPKNFLINFVINIDKYERSKIMTINGISDYINYYKRSEIVNYLNNTINQNISLQNPEFFTEIVLNNVEFNCNDGINVYISKKNKEDLIQLIYSSENYIFNYLNENSDTVIAYNLYNHDDLENANKEDLILYLTTYNKKISINNLDEYIKLIENRNFTYINNDEYLNSFTENELLENILIFETYLKRQTNKTKSLRGLKDYIKNMSIDYKKDILAWGLDLFPELYEKSCFQNIISNEYNLQYGQVKQFIKVTQRDTLLKYVYNIHTFQNSINSIYNNSIFDIYRYNNDKLYDLILKDTNDNKELKEKNIFTDYACLHENNLNIYVKNLSRNQLKIFVNSIIELYFETKTLEFSKMQKPSEKKERIDTAMNEDTSDLLKTAEKHINFFNYEKTSDFFDDEEKYIKNISNFFNHYDNIMDFLRSTNIQYLKLWLRKYEKIIRKLKSVQYVEGGMKTNFMSEKEYSKKKLIDIFDIYIFEYPALFTPEKFLQITGLDSKNTPHKYIIDLKYNSTEIKNIFLSILAHYQRKNIQLNFPNDEYLLNFEYNYNLTSNNYIYQIFRFINIFPELTNLELFKKICVDEKTKIIDTQYNDIIDIEISYFKYRNITQLAKNVNYYYIHSEGFEEEKKIDINGMTKNELKNYIGNFMDKTDTFQNKDILGRVLDGDFYQLFYDNNENYLNNINKPIIIDNICKRLQTICKTKKCEIKCEDKIKEIINIIENYEEFQTPQFFDNSVDIIDLESEGYNEIVKDIYNFLKNVDNKNLFYYCLIANIIKIEYENKNGEINGAPLDIYLKIHYMSRNEMIRYILDIISLNEDFRKKLSEENLPILVKKYGIDIGSDNIYDLTIY